MTYKFRNRWFGFHTTSVKGASNSIRRTVIYWWTEDKVELSGPALSIILGSRMYNFVWFTRMEAM